MSQAAHPVCEIAERRAWGETTAPLDRSVPFSRVAPDSTNFLRELFAAPDTLTAHREDGGEQRIRITHASFLGWLAFDGSPGRLRWDVEFERKGGARNGQGSARVRREHAAA